MLILDVNHLTEFDLITPKGRASMQRLVRRIDHRKSSEEFNRGPF